MNLILMNSVLGGSDGMRGKSLLNENAIIILSLNQSEWRKLLRSASSRIGFSLDTDRRFLRTSGFKEKMLMLERIDDMLPCW